MIVRHQVQWDGVEVLILSSDLALGHRTREGNTTGRCMLMGNFYFLEKILLIMVDISGCNSLHISSPNSY